MSDSKNLDQTDESPPSKNPKRESSDPLDIEIPSTSQNTSQNTPTKNALPPWVAGSSPAKFFTLDDILKVNDSIEKMALAHEIAIDPNFRIENMKKKDPIEEAVQKTMRTAYWDKLREDLRQDPPDYGHCLVLLGDVKDQVVDLLTEKHGRLREQIDSALDVELLRRQIEMKTIDMQLLFSFVLEILSRLCAPVRDETIEKLKSETDLVEMFKGIFDLLENMHLDMANFTVSANRHNIERYSAQFERDQFMKILEVDPDGAARTKSTFEEALRQYLLEHSEKAAGTELTNEDVANVITQVYMSLLEKSAFSGEVSFPETLKLDEGRIMAMGEKFLQLVIASASIFVASNLAGKDICESTSFKKDLKNALIVILNDINSKNYKEKLENVWLQCDLEIKKHSKSWDPSFSEMLKNQILSLATDENPIRKISRDRIFGFMFSIIRSPGAVQVRLPPGLSVVQSELAALTSKFLHITSHNWKAFGTFYGEILGESYKKIKAN